MNKPSILWKVGFFLSGFLFLSPLSGSAVSLDRLTDEEITLVKSILKTLDPVIQEKKKQGTAPLLTFEELRAPLGPDQRRFLDEIRGLGPKVLNGSSQRQPPVPPKTEFIRLDRQVVLRDGKPVRLDTQYFPRQAYEAYCRMMAAMEADLGKRLLIESGYRSPAYQLYLFVFYLSNHDYSVRETNRHVALPGCSEHGAPLHQAADFITPAGINGEDRPEEFEELQEYGWLQARANEFGFYLSYPRGGPSAFEPWHWHWESRENG